SATGRIWRFRCRRRACVRGGWPPVTAQRIAFGPGRRRDIMDLRQLRYFVEVAEVSGFNEAAARLRVSQSSVSRRVRDLELELKVQLFERDPGGARLTASGRILLERALSILREIEVAKNDVVTGSTAPVGVVTVGFSSASGQLFIP